MAEPTKTRQSYLALQLTASGGTFLAMLDSTVTNLAVPDLRQDFTTASVADLSWVISAYIVIFAALLTPAGRLADVLGRRRLFVGGIGLFTVASLLCALAPALPVLITFRVLQGAGAAAMIPASLAILLLDGPADRRTASIGLWSATSALAAAIGPSVGGVLVDAFGWRSVFIINLPFGILLMLATRALVPASVRSERERIPDPLGTILLALGVAALTLGLTEGPTWGWLDPVTLLCFAFGLASVSFALQRSRAHPAPAIETSLWGHRPFAVANVVSLLYGIAQYPWLLVSVLYLTEIWKYSELVAGAAMTPGAIVASVAALGMGRLAPRFGGPRFATLLGLTAFAACGVWLTFGLTDHPAFVSLWLPAGCLVGIGMGITTMGTSSAAALSAPMTRFASASGLNTTARQFGGALGIAAMAVILQISANPDRSLSVTAYGRVYLFCTVVVLAALLISVVWLRGSPPPPPSQAATPATDRTNADQTGSPR